MTKQQTLKGNIHLLSKREFLIWIISIGVTIVWGFLTRGIQWGADIGTFVNSLNVIASMFALGLPIFLLTGLMFTSPTSRRYLLQRTNQGVKHKKLLLIRFTQCLILVSFYVVITTPIVFVEPVISYLFLNYSISLGYFVYLPSALIASLIVGLVLTAVATLLTLAIDNMHVSVILGSAATLFVSWTAGWDAQALNWSLTPDLALVSPHNLVKMLAAVLSNYDFTIYTRDEMYFGISISPMSTLFSVTGFVLLGVAAIAISLPLLRVSMSRWPILSEMVDTPTIWEESNASHDPRIIAGTRKKVRLQRTVVVFLVCTLLLSLGMGKTVLTQDIVNRSSLVHYQSPEGGESIAVGTWTVIEFNIAPPYPGLPTYLEYSVEIVSWGSCPDALSYTHAFLMMGQSEFLQLNESSRLELCRTPRNRTRGDWGGFGGDLDIEEQFGIHIFVFYVYATTNSSLGGALHASIEISQRSG